MMLMNLMELFIKPEVLEQNGTAYKLANLDVAKGSLEPRKVNIGNGARQALTASEVSDVKKLDFFNACLTMLKAIVCKLQDRCPLKYSLLRSLKSLDPQVWARNDNSSQRSFQTLTQKLVATKRKAVDICDMAERQYAQVARDQQKNAELQGFDPKSGRLDEFYYRMFAGKEEWKELYQIIQLVLTLSHGQASVERSFSVNEDILLPNMRAETLYAIKLVHDTIRTTGIKVHDFKVTDRMLQFCR